MRRLVRGVSLGNRLLWSTVRCVCNAGGESRSSTMSSGLGVESIGESRDYFLGTFCFGKINDCLARLTCVCCVFHVFVVHPSKW